MQLRSMLVGGSIVISGLAMPACSGSGVSDPGDGGTSGGGGDGASSCVSAGKRICERACTCGSAPKCKTGFRNAYGSFATFTWSDAPDCEGNYAVSRCKNGGSPTVDYAACTTAVDAAACEGDVFVVPSACEAARDGGK
jgi:hypothetical protein